MSPREACESVGVGIGEQIKLSFPNGDHVIMQITGFGERKALFKKVCPDGINDIEDTWGTIDFGAGFAKVHPTPIAHIEHRPDDREGDTFIVWSKSGDTVSLGVRICDHEICRMNQLNAIARRKAEEIVAELNEPSPPEATVKPPGWPIRSSKETAEYLRQLREHDTKYNIGPYADPYRPTPVNPPPFVFQPPTKNDGGSEAKGMPSVSPDATAERLKVAEAILRDIRESGRLPNDSVELNLIYCFFRDGTALNPRINTMKDYENVKFSISYILSKPKEPTT